MAQRAGSAAASGYDKNAFQILYAFATVLFINSVSSKA